jgi:hypothetical protein
MDFVSVRVITHDVERLATFWEQVTGLPAARPVPVFAKLKRRPGPSRSAPRRPLGCSATPPQCPARTAPSSSSRRGVLNPGGGIRLLVSG